jgi:hypothetical protein
MVNKDLIRHILKEETRDTKSELIRQIKDEGLYSVAELVGGLDNLKKILKDNPSMVERIENQKGLVKVSWTTDGDDPSIVLPFKIIGAGWNIWMTNSWPIVNIIYNENKLTKDENYKFKDFLYDSFNDESSVRVIKLNSDEPRMHKTYVQLGEINGKTAQKNTTDLSRSYDLSDIREIVETLGDDNMLKEGVDNTKENQKNLRTIDKSENKKLKLVKNIIYDMFDTVIDLEYDSKINEIMVYHNKKEKLEISEICDTINNFTNLNVVPWFEYDKNRIGKEPDFYLDVDDYDEAINENYSPAGKEITPNKIVIHKSNPKFRDRISNEGLKASAGECYKIYAGYGEKCIPAIFATNSTNKRAWFDSTYDDDVWEINTEMIPNVKWYKDRHFESTKKHIVTFDNIPSEAIELMSEGTGRDIVRESSENKDMDNDIEKNLKVIRMLLKQVNWEGLCNIWVEYNPVDKDYEIRSKSMRRDYYLPQNVVDEIFKELNFIEESIKAMGLRPYIFSASYVENCEDEVEFMNESINKSDEKRNKIIEKIMDNIIFPEYNHIICGYDVKNDEVFNEPVVNVTFIGGYGTKLWPTTQGIQKMYSDVLDEIWNVIYDYINIPVGVTMKTTPKCDEQENIYLRK